MFKTFGNSRLKNIPTYLTSSLVGLVIILPVLWLFLSSFKSREELSAYPMQLLPQHIDLLRYYNMLVYSEVTPTLIRTFFLGITTAAITCITSAMAGYAFARINGIWRKQLFSIVIALMIVPNIILLIPQFILYAHYHIINTYWPWYLAALGATNPLYIFMYRQFFISFPKELEEAAEIDGATPAGIFLSIILPNSKPAMATVLIFAFNAIWGDYLMPTMFLNDPSQLMGTWLAGWPVSNPFVLTLAIIYILPMIILFSMVQKNIQKGMLFTGLSN